MKTPVKNLALLSLRYNIAIIERNKNHLGQRTPSTLPLNADALVLMALGCYHHVSLIQDEHFDFLGIYEFQLGTPVQHSAGCADYNLLRDLLTSLHCRDRKEGLRKMAAQTVKCPAPL